jgi:hypothetical protein
MIPDVTDAVPHKAHVIADKRWWRFWDDIDAALEAAAQGADPVQLSMQLRQGVAARFLWECRVCGRMLFDDPPEAVRSYQPEKVGPRVLK